MLKLIIQTIRARISRLSPSQEHDVPGTIAALKQEDPHFDARLSRALLIIKSDQETFAKYTGHITGHFDLASALHRLVAESGIHERGLKQSLPLQVDEVIRTGRRYADRRDVENAFKSYGLMIGLRR